MHLFRYLLATALALAGSASGREPPSARASFLPVLQENFPDPFVLSNGGEYVAYSTNDGPNVPMIHSTDLVHWSFVTDPITGRKRDALPSLGSWAKTGFTWAPEVLHLGNNYLLYYTAGDRRRNAQCVGVAVASEAHGPFVDSSPEPIVCQTKLGGTIDADAFRDVDGKLYLYFKNDGNRVHARTFLWGQRLSDDGRIAVGEPVRLLGDKERWKEAVIEAPSMVRGPAGYTLFYSGGFFGWNLQEGGFSPYAMGYASCAGPLGPCKDSPDNPILHSFNDRQSGCLSGPGHQSIFEARGRLFISFHAWAATSVCSKAEEKRYLYIAPLFWKNGKPQLAPSLR